MKSSRYDHLARPYRALEFLAFGRALERARFRYLDRLHDRQRILLLGDGDGRALARICQLAPQAQIESVDSSAGMLARAAQRLCPADRERVTFREADAFIADYPPNTYDAVTTLFFLDLFSPDQVQTLVGRLRPALTDDAIWLFADFSQPSGGWARAWAQAWLVLLFVFFRWQTGLVTRELPPSESLLQAAGLDCEAETSWQGGFLRSAVYGCTFKV